MIRYIKKNKILFCFTLIINLLTCLTPLFLAYIIENVSGIFLNQDESKNNCELMADRSFYDLSSFVFIFEFKI